LNGRRPTNVYGLWQNIGYGYNGSNQSDNSQFRITAVGSADIGDHALSLGLNMSREQIDILELHLLDFGV
jgi:hypothetical protein